MIRLTCGHCGRELQARPEVAGRSMLCPGCQNSVSIGATPTPPRAGLLWRAVLTVVLLLAILGGAAAGGWWLWNRPAVPDDGPEVSDLALVPADARSIILYRPAKLDAIPAARAAIEQIPDHETPIACVRHMTGLEPPEVDRLLVVTPREGDAFGWTVVRTAEPINRDRVLARWGSASGKRHLGRRYYLRPDGNAVHFAGPRVLVLASEFGMRPAMAQASRPVSEGPLKATIDLIETSKSLVLVGLNAEAEALDALKQKLTVKPPAMEKLSVIVMTLDIGGEKATFAGTAELPDAESAQNLEFSLRLLIGFIRTKLPDWNKQKAEAIDEVLRQLHFTPNGTRLEASASGNPGKMLAAILFLNRWLQSPDGVQP